MPKLLSDEPWLNDFELTSVVLDFEDDPLLDAALDAIITDDLLDEDAATTELLDLADEAADETNGELFELDGDDSDDKISDENDDPKDDEAAGIPDDTGTLEDEITLACESDEAMPPNPRTSSWVNVVLIHSVIWY